MNEINGSYFELKCYKNFDMGYEVTLRTKKADKLCNVHRRLRDRFNLLDGELSRLWRQKSEDYFELLDLDDSVELAGLKGKDILVLQTQQSGKWCQNNPVTEATPSKSDKRCQKLPIPETTSSLKKCSISTNGNDLSEKRGICGLMNLGNTCYMNSVIQCLSNCPPLTEYFLEEKHLSELNTTNILGMRGEIARAYGDLINIIWSGKHLSTKPFQFKAQLSRFNSQFSGFSQHDAQELLTFLLDGLHEDLNRVTQKPYIERRDRKGLPDHKMAKEAWAEHKMRNDSIVVDTFHGLFKSQVICPQCENLSVTFDPFCTLSVPIPVNRERFIKVNFIPKEPTERDSSFKIAVPRKGLVRELCKQVSLRTNTDHTLLVPAEVSNIHFHKFYAPEDSLDCIEDKEVLYIYEMPEEANDSNHAVVPVYFWDLSRQKVNISLKKGFGIPLLLVFSKNDLKEKKIGFCILNQIKKRFNLPVTNSGKNSKYMPKIYLVDTDYVGDPLLLQFDEFGRCKNDILELLEEDNPYRDFGRKMLIVDLSLAGKEEYLAAFSSDTDCSSKKCSRSSSKLHIYDCIDLFASCEKLGSENAWFCPVCKQHQRATKKFSIWMLPKILIVHLKRFSYSRYGDKLATPIEFPMRDLNLFNYIINPSQQQVSYDLIGVINHYGSMSGGHYTAFCRNKITGSWYCFNDSVVSKIGEDEVLTSNAYVLFYCRKNNGSQDKNP